jgi:two-component system, NtrC family, response regulator AtoC
VITSTTITETCDEERPPDGDGGGLHLLVMSPDSFATLPLPSKGVLTIGRSTRSDVQIDDPLASRDHGRLHIDERGFFIEDLGSANGTRVHETTIQKGIPLRVNPGEGITIGSTVLMVQQNRSRLGAQRLWSHAYFESRLEAECSRTAEVGGTFALARLRLPTPIPWATLAPVFAVEVPAPHILGAYAPHDYEILLLDTGPEGAEAVVSAIRARLAPAAIAPRTAIATFPRHGRTADALIAEVNGLLRGPHRTPQEPALTRVQELAARAAPSSINVLILGETGVGKEVMASSIHQRSPRADKPLLALNCAGLTESLIESELFGHEKGAFTGAVQSKPGLLETAEGGTVFLDELGEMPASVQAKLLRVIETRLVMRVGALKPRSIDVRFISATNCDLEDEIRQGRFRRDLFFRLNGMTLTIPPLRERVSEIGDLAMTFLRQACADTGRPVPTISAEVVQVLEAYSWPGNIRELKNVMERALVLCEREIGPEHLPLEKLTYEARLYDSVSKAADTLPGPAPRSLFEELRRDERERMLAALQACGGNQTRAAESLGMPRRTFVSKLDRYGLPRPRKREGQPATDSTDRPDADEDEEPSPRTE